MPPAWNQSRRTTRRYRLNAERLEPRLLLSADSCGQNEWLRTDGEGNAYFIDPLPASPPSDDGNDVTEGDGAFGGVQGAGGSLDDVPILHSDPLAAKKILLDFNGHTVVGTAWNSSNNGNPIHAPAFDKDGDIFSFNDTELSAIVDIWEQVVEDFAPFQVDISTEEPGEAFFAAGSQGIRLLISDNVDDSRLGGTGYKWFDDAGGVAYINSWTMRSDTPAWVFSQDLGGSIKKIAEASSHEIGHTLGLSHDGQTGGVLYYEGHGSGNTGWAPIMGTAYYKPLSQWSRGEYTNANNVQNDLTIISGKIAYRDDDHSDSTTAEATPLMIENSTISASGPIGNSTDRDVFSLSVETWQAAVAIQVNPWHNNPNLDVLLELRQSNGVLITASNPTSELSAALEDTLEPGTYYVTVQGTGEGDPDTGYSDYGSLGQYTISGSVIILEPSAAFSWATEPPEWETLR